MEPLILLEHVSVARGGRVVLRDVSLRIERSEHVALLGPNGCGKSTLLKTLTCECYPLLTPPGMERPVGTPLAAVEGVRPRVRVLGRERWDVTELRRRLGVVSAEPPGAQTSATTGFEAVLTGFFSSTALWPNLEVTAAMRARAAEVLRLTSSESLGDKRVGEMSAGEQRRVMIARALAGASLGSDGAIAPTVELLLLDEPSNALDVVAQRQLREMLRTLAAAGTTVLLITHHVADIFPEMRRVVMMREGRVFADGAKDELLTTERMSAVFGGVVEVRKEGEWFAV